MKEKTIFKIKIMFVLLILVLGIVAQAASERLAPETVLVRVLKPDNLTPETNADCKADIISNQGVVEDKPVKKIESMFEYIDLDTWDVNHDKGYYELTTNLKDYKGNFEIRIVCISPGFKGVSYTILNNTNIPCELKDNGKFLIC